MGTFFLAHTKRQQVSAMRLALFSSIFCAVATRSIDEKEQHDMLRAVLKDPNRYDKLMRPTYKVEVSISMFIDTMSSVSTESMDYDVTIFFRQHWNDPRLAWGKSGFDGNPDTAYRVDGLDVVDSDLLDLIWIPDIHFVGEKQARRHDIIRKNVLLDITADGDITYSDRLTMKLGCNMDFRDFPFDKQLCPIKMEPYANRKKQLNLSWHVMGTAAEKAQYKGSIQFSSEIKLPAYERGRCFLEEECTMAYITGEFSCLSSHFELSRTKKYYMLNVYLPSMLCVILASASFWIQLDLAPARIGLGITTFLTMVALMQYMNEGVPRTSYTKAIDVWMGICLFYIFLAMIEYCIAHVFLRAETEERLNQDSEAALPTELPQSTVVDKHSRWFFPIMFLFLLFVYSVSYSTDPLYQDKLATYKQIECGSA